MPLGIFYLQYVSGFLQKQAPSLRGPEVSNSVVWNSEHIYSQKQCHIQQLDFQASFQKPIEFLMSENLLCLFNLLSTICNRFNGKKHFKVQVRCQNLINFCRHQKLRIPLDIQGYLGVLLGSGSLCGMSQKRMGLTVLTAVPSPDSPKVLDYSQGDARSLTSLNTRLRQKLNQGIN